MTHPSSLFILPAIPLSGLIELCGALRLARNVESQPPASPIRCLYVSKAFAYTLPIRPARIPSEGKFLEISST